MPRPTLARRAESAWILAALLLLAAAPAAQAANDMVIAKRGPASVNVGDVVTYTLRAFNGGTAPVGPAGSGTGVIVTDAIPAGFALVSPHGGSTPFGLVAVPGGWTCGVPSLTCVYGGAPVPKDSYFPPIPVVVRAVAMGAFQQCANITRMGFTDAFPANNKSCVGVVVKPKLR